MRHHPIALFGCEEPVEPPRTLSAGPLTATLQGGNLRHIRVGGHEAIRAISCVVRDPEWGTYAPAISDLVVEDRTDGFLVHYDALCREAGQEYRYRARIEGRPDGIVFRMTGEAVTDFRTARLGFVVLHPIEGVSGCPVHVLHSDGAGQATSFPALIEPYQPIMDIRALTHEVMPGVRVTCRMDGDVFEMEDQRNWTDASYKTYVRPIGLPWPYLIARGEVSEQSVTLTVAGEVAGEAAPAGPVRLVVGGVTGTMPSIGLQLDPDTVLSTDELALLRELGPAHLRVRCDLRRHDRSAMAAARQVADAVGTQLHLEAVLPGLELDGEASALAEIVRTADLRPAQLLVAPAADLKGTLPGSAWPDCPPLEQVYRATRAAFPDAMLGGGSYCFFTELNRKRPPVALLDVVTFSTSAIVHAADDVSVMETLACLPSVFASARAIAGGCALHVGPSNIGCRDNPYGAAAAANPEGVRKAMTDRDPRQRGQFGAAWTAGYLARCVQAGVEAVTLSAPVDAFGTIHREDADAASGSSGRPPAVYPVYHVLRAASAGAGLPVREVRSDEPDQVLAFAWEAAGGTTLLVANLTPTTRSVVIDGLEPRSWTVLDAGHHHDAASRPDFLQARAAPATGDPLELGPYAICLLSRADPAATG